jgi:hypothetical protein
MIGEHPSIKQAVRSALMAARYPFTNVLIIGESGTGKEVIARIIHSETKTAQNYVQLSWTTESETNMLGFRILRGELEDLSSATLITPVMIGATNTSTTQHYSLTDSEVMIGSTYYYWLEAVDMGTSSYHGPQSVTVTGSSTPALPGITALGNAYPNPFRQSTNISLAVKEGENASVTIYNIMGQVVRTFSKGQGNHLISWDGRDSRGNACGSGIYFYKLSSSSLNQTKKLIIVK